jgi:hypothetical protein
VTRERVQRPLCEAAACEPCEGETVPLRATCFVQPVKARPLLLNKQEALCTGCAVKQATAYIEWGWGATVLPITTR